MMRVREGLAAGAAIWAVVLGLVCGPALGRDVKLAIHPQKMSVEAGKLALLPPAASLTEGDAVPLYEKALKARPGKVVDDRIQAWWKMPIEQLPLDQVEKTLTLYVESFKGVAQAVKCRECKWPVLTPEALMPNLQEYRNLGAALRLWARYEIAQENYEGAILALQTGFAMGRHLTQGSALMQYLTGVAITSMMCTEVGEFVQAEEAPNLYRALAALPHPFTDVDRLIEIDRKAAASEWSGKLTAEQLDSELKKSHDQVRIVAQRLETDLAALQGVEALRSYAASHGGQLPQTLAEITEVSVPKDPISGAEFHYTRTGAAAVLESATPAGGDAKNVTRYEITVKN